MWEWRKDSCRTPPKILHLHKAKPQAEPRECSGVTAITHVEVVGNPSRSFVPPTEKKREVLWKANGVTGLQCVSSFWRSSEVNRNITFVFWKLPTVLSAILNTRPQKACSGISQTEPLPRLGTVKGCKQQQEAIRQFLFSYKWSLKICETL